MQYQYINPTHITLFVLILSFLVGLGLSAFSPAQKPSRINSDTSPINRAVLPLTNFSQQVEMSADEDLFGTSVAMKGNIAVVGAPGRAAYIFEKPADGGWAKATETAKLTASDGKTGDRFSFSLAIDTDTILVGAYRYNLTAGAIYIYEKAADGWADMTEIGKLTIDDDRELDHYFGFSMAISGNTLFVGTLGELNEGAGAVYIFEKPAVGSWAKAKQIARLVSADSEAGDQFGSAIAVSGDTLVIGAASKKNATGAVYVFEKPAAGSWADVSEITKLVASDGVEGSFFGAAVAIDAEAIVVGAPDVGFQGSAYLFKKLDNSWANTTSVKTAKLTATDNQGQDEFGASVAIKDNTIFISAPCDGAVYLFEGSNQIDKLPIEMPPGAMDFFGCSIAVNDDTLLIGANTVDEAIGAAYIFE